MDICEIGPSQSSRSVVYLNAEAQYAPTIRQIWVEAAGEVKTYYRMFDSFLCRFLFWDLLDAVFLVWLRQVKVE